MKTVARIPPDESVGILATFFMKNTKKLLILGLIVLAIGVIIINFEIFSSKEARLEQKREEIIVQYEEKTPQQWGVDVDGVVRKIDTDEMIIALTLDACGGSGGSGYDEELIEFLRAKEIPATLFINTRWIEENKKEFKELVADSLFEIENHGTEHLPLSTTGKSAYGIKGTESVAEVVDEVIVNRLKIKELTGKTPNYFRSGTAHYDELAVEIVNKLGEEVIGFDLSGDGGAQFSKEETRDSFLQAQAGSIILAHMNQPQSETAKGIMAAIPELKEKGFRFVKLKDYDNQLKICQVPSL